MKYNEAQKIIQEKSYLIGKKYKGGVIDELVIYPSNEKAKNQFKDVYIKTLNAEIAIAPFKDFDVDVSAIVDKDKIKTSFFMAVNIDEVERIIAEKN
jgi:hypothetical protein